MAIETRVNHQVLASSDTPFSAKPLSKNLSDQDLSDQRDYLIQCKLKEKEDLLPKLMNLWKMDDGSIKYSVEVPHHTDLCDHDPIQLCPGIVKVNFTQGETGIKTATCWKCKEETEVDLGNLQDAMKIYDKN